ncbi:MAG: hypothetical protein ACH346_01505 [Chthoniobacterales bacterium]
MIKITSPRFYKTPLILPLFGMLLVSGCADRDTSSQTPSVAHSKFGYGGTNSDSAYLVEEPSASTSPATPTNTVATNVPVNPFLSPIPQSTATSRDIPYGTPVPGKSGYVISPYSPNAGYVDVHGFPPGTEVKDPYSQKIFLVP